jgi:hypothetical protein
MRKKIHVKNEVGVLFDDINEKRFVAFKKRNKLKLFLTIDFFCDDEPKNK